MVVSFDIIQGQNENNYFSIRSRTLVFGNMERQEYGDGAVIMDGCEVSPNIVTFS
jgi:hypothetical protein